MACGIILSPWSLLDSHQADLQQDRARVTFFLYT
jgi:hypothetical protein